MYGMMVLLLWVASVERLKHESRSSHLQLMQLSPTEVLLDHDQLA